MSDYADLAAGGNTIVTVFRRRQPWAAWNMEGRFKLQTAVVQYCIKPPQLRKIVSALAEHRSFDFKRAQAELRFSPPQSDEGERFAVGR